MDTGDFPDLIDDGDDDEHGDLFAEDRPLDLAYAERLARVLRYTDERLDGIEAAKRNLKVRAERFERKRERLRLALLGTLQVLGRKRIDLPELTAFRRAKKRAVIVTDVSKLEARFVREKIVREADKELLREAMETDGEIVEGAELSNDSETIVLKLT